MAESGLPAWSHKFEGDASWFTNKEEFEKLVESISEDAGTPKQLTVYGRPLSIPWQVDGQVARFKFSDLCEQVRLLSYMNVEIVVLTMSSRYRHLVQQTTSP